MDVLRTPDERFEALPDWDFAPRYREVVAADGTPLRFHFVDEGPRDVAPLLLLHGNPSWSYLHRHMIRGLVDRGHRVLALDLMGMGRSDKPTDRAELTVDSHLDWMGQWLAAEDLADITLYCQDWGGLLGLNLVRLQPDRFARILASNTGLPAGEGTSPALQAWIEFSQSASPLPVGAIVDGGTSRALSDAERAAYDAPYPDATYQASPVQFPLLIPAPADHPAVPLFRATWDFLETWTRPFLTVFGSEDAIAFKPGSHLKFQRKVPGAAGQPHRVIEGANHFIQEDAPDELVEVLDAFARSGPGA
jgi:haloalkane dehalogenase